MQSSEHILLIRPSHFVFNQQTAGSNAFQHVPAVTDDTLATTATGEFNLFAQTLQEAGVKVTIIDDTEFPVKPDAVFPNNWISTHMDGTVVIYPMFAPNRRLEKRKDIVDVLRQKFIIRNVIDLSNEETSGRFLEGTGSIIFDHINKVAYACISPRTNEDLFMEVCGLLGYSPVSFFSYDRSGKEVYHTNVMMCVAEKFAVVCMESITHGDDKINVARSLARTGHTLVEISMTQMNHFAGNMLTVKNKDQEDLLVMSQSAFDILTEDQRHMIGQHCRLLPIPIKTIEHIGGGSARCMMAEIFLPEKQDLEP